MGGTTEHRGPARKAYHREAETKESKDKEHARGVLVAKPPSGEKENGTSKSACGIVAMMSRQFFTGLRIREGGERE